MYEVAIFFMRKKELIFKLINAKVVFVKRDDCQKKYNYQDECDPLRSLLTDGLKFETLFQEGIGKRVSSIITPKLAEITVFK